MSLTTDELESKWLELKSLLKQEDGVKTLIQGVAKWDDPKLRNQMYRYVIRKLGGGSITTPEALDQMDAIGTFAISHALEQADDGDDRRFWLEEANVSAYNLAANLCDCWGDGERRQLRHFGQGLVFADWALDLRLVLQKDAASFALAHWVRGKHLLSLKRSEEAIEAFSETIKAEIAARVEKDGVSAQEAADSSRDSPSQLMALAFLGLARMQAGQDPKLYDESLLLLRDMVSHGGEAADSAKFYLAQIEESARLNL